VQQLCHKPNTLFIVSVSKRSRRERDTHDGRPCSEPGTTRACMRSIASHDANGSVSSSGTGFVPSKGRDARQASGALDAGEKSADEDSVDADVYKFSEHLWGVCGGRAEGRERCVLLGGRGSVKCLCHVMPRVEHSWTDRTHDIHVYKFYTIQPSPASLQMRVSSG
jgi:hypothetical protein